MRRKANTVGEGTQDICGRAMTSNLALEKVAAFSPPVMFCNLQSEPQPKGDAGDQDHSRSCASAAISLGTAYFGDGSDLMSYLPFTPKYTRALIDIGYRDADARIDEIEEFLYSDSNRTSGIAARAVPVKTGSQQARLSKPRVPCATRGAEIQSDRDERRAARAESRKELPRSTRPRLRRAPQVAAPADKYR
jgi:hypothetical protein